LEAISQHVGSRENRQHALRRLGRRGVDIPDPGVRMRRANHHGMCGARQASIIGILALPGDKPKVLPSAKGCGAA
jgi:hypothetical protein